jgi:hypothetical protein
MVWKEHHIHGLTPLPGLGRLPRWSNLALVGLISTALSAIILVLARPAPPVGKAPPTPPMPPVHVLFPVDPRLAEAGFLVLALTGLLAASLAVGVRASAAVSGEREAGTWDTLLTTPLEPHHLLRGKLQGILLAAVPYVVVFAAPLLSLALLGGFLAFLWPLLVLLVAPLAMYYVGAAGIYSSVRCPDSTRSLVWTLAFGYLGASFIGLATAPLTAVVTGMVHQFLAAIKERHGYDISLGASPLAASILIGCCLGLGLALFLAARKLLRLAEQRLLDKERVRQGDPPRRRGRSADFGLRIAD